MVQMACINLQLFQILLSTPTSCQPDHIILSSIRTKQHKPAVLVAKIHTPKEKWVKTNWKSPTLMERTKLFLCILAI